MECKIHTIDDEIRTVVRGQTNVGQVLLKNDHSVDQVLKQCYIICIVSLKIIQR